MRPAADGLISGGAGIFGQVRDRDALILGRGVMRKVLLYWNQSVYAYPILTGVPSRHCIESCVPKGRLSRTSRFDLYLHLHAAVKQQNKRLSQSHFLDDS
jgi:hypothetical protein